MRVREFTIGLGAVWHRGHSLRPWAAKLSFTLNCGSSGFDTAVIARSDPREDELDSCSFPGRTLKIDRAAQAIGDDIVHDVQTEAGAALITTGGEKWVE